MIYKTENREKKQAYTQKIMGKATVLKLASDGFSLPSVLIFRSQFNTPVSILLLRKVYTDFLN